MKLRIYRGLINETVPEDVTHVIVHESVTVIKKDVFSVCEYLVSVIMGDSVKIIERSAFYQCRALRFVRLSRTLECIGEWAFAFCDSLEALFLPSTVKSVEEMAFGRCRSLKLLILPHDIDLDNVGQRIITSSGIQQIAENAGVAYQIAGFNNHRIIAASLIAESIRQVHEWLFRHMDEWPFHKLCYASSITTKQIYDYLIDNGNDLALQIDPHHGMTPLHMLSMNPHAPADAIASLFNSNMEAIFCVDNQQKTPLQYARDYNVGGLVEMINSLCSHRNASIAVVEADASIENTRSSKRRKLED
jgi:hypothetical protein